MSARHPESSPWSPDSAYMDRHATRARPPRFVQGRVQLGVALLITVAEVRSGRVTRTGCSQPLQSLTPPDQGAAA